MSPLTLTPIIHVALLAYLYVRSGVLQRPAEGWSDSQIGTIAAAALEHNRDPERLIARVMALDQDMDQAEQTGVPVDDRFRIEPLPDGSGHFLASPDMVPLPLRETRERRDGPGQPFVEIAMEWDGEHFARVTPTAGDYREGGV